jgi:hypothetical protein
MNVTEHPEELLAEYVDGTLDERVRRDVELHLAACATCRAEVDLAAAAADVLARLPEEPVPLGLTGPVLSEIEREDRREERPWGRRIQWIAGAAAAAALIAVVAVSVPDLGGSGEPGAGSGADLGAAEAGDDGAAQSARAYPPVPLEELDVNYDDEALAALSDEVAAQAGRGEDFAPPAEGTGAVEERALGCVGRGAGVGEQDVLVRLISARYKKEPVYVAVYLDGPGIGQPPRSVVIWVVSAETCEFREFTSQRI